jgi:protein TonB
MLAVAILFAGAGIAGTARPVVDLDFKERRTPQTPPPVVPVEDISMSDLAELPAEPEAAAGLPVQPLPADATLPEPLLTEDDVFVVPQAAPVESALRVVEPTPVRPSPAPQPKPANSSPSRPAAASVTNGAALSASTGGAEGTATSGRGGKGKFPKPPYPAFAKAKGLTGTVTLSIKVSATGDVISASVSGSSGSSELDSHAASWVSRRWKWPAGAARSFRLPVSFRLK